ncbi:hypothetical protein BJ508DRAFT_332886 [Ascobolus immersus RN42]|uniref:Uncharacterized protein n=1 Tax=Ascobolus immersus RN42 TaxID=1160509 RepID=A0A3N4HS32_ASCIM|nr:hypothetical protein BJ508DRAFT_332886 [Ascobolus immersus RN42]
MASTLCIYSARWPPRHSPKPEKHFYQEQTNSPTTVLRRSNTSALTLFRHHSGSIRKAVSIVYRLANRTTDSTPDEEDSFTLRLTRGEYLIFVRTIGTNTTQYKRVKWDYDTRRQEITIEMPSFLHEGASSACSGIMFSRSSMKVESCHSDPRDQMQLLPVRGSTGSVGVATLVPDGSSVIQGVYHTFQADNCFYTRNHVVAYGEPYPSVVLETALSQSLTKLHRRLIRWIAEGRGRVSYAVGFYIPKFEFDPLKPNRLPPTRLLAYKKGQNDPVTAVYAIKRCECRWIIDRDGKAMVGTHRISMKHFMYISKFNARVCENPDLIRPSNELLREDCVIDFAEYQAAIWHEVKNLFGGKPRRLRKSNSIPEHGKTIRDGDVDYTSDNGSDPPTSGETSMLADTSLRSEHIQRAVNRQILGELELANAQLNGLSIFDNEEDHVEEQENGDNSSETSMDHGQPGGSHHNGLFAETNEDKWPPYEVNTIENPYVASLVEDDQDACWDADDDGCNEDVEADGAAMQLVKDQLESARRQVLRRLPTHYPDDPYYDEEEDLMEDPGITEEADRPLVPFCFPHRR